MVMQLFDCKWSKKLEHIRIMIWMMIRYVDDIRVAFPPIREGRDGDGEIVPAMATRQQNVALLMMIFSIFGPFLAFLVHFWHFWPIFRYFDSFLAFLAV